MLVHVTTEDRLKLLPQLRRYRHANRGIARLQIHLVVRDTVAPDHGRHRVQYVLDERRVIAEPVEIVQKSEQPFLIFGTKRFHRCYASGPRKVRCSASARATASARFTTPSFMKIRSTCLSTVRRLI